MSKTPLRNDAIEAAITRMFMVVSEEQDAGRFSGTAAMVMLTYAHGTHLHVIGADEGDEAYAKAIETLQKRLDHVPATFKVVKPLDTLQ